MNLPNLRLVLKRGLAFWPELNRNQKISFLFFVFFLLLVPISVLVAIFPVRLQQRAQETCPGSHPCFSIYYGEVYLNGVLAPVGTSVKFYSPRGDLVGCQTVGSGNLPQAGTLPFTYVYGTEGSVFSGMNIGDQLFVKVDGLTARIEPEPTFFSSCGSQTHITIYQDPSPVITPSPTLPPPPPSCTNGVKNFSLDTPCENDLFRYFRYTCFDGFFTEDGGPTSCKSVDTWYQYAKEACLLRGCPSPSPFPTPSLAPSPTQFPLPTPTIPSPCQTDCGRSPEVLYQFENTASSVSLKNQYQYYVSFAPATDSRLLEFSVYIGNWGGGLRQATCKFTDASGQRDISQEFKTELFRGEAWRTISFKGYPFLRRPLFQAGTTYRLYCRSDDTYSSLFWKGVKTQRAAKVLATPCCQ